MRGDVLARGAVSAQFPSMSYVSQDKWDSIFGKRELNIKKPNKAGVRRGKNTQTVGNRDHQT